MGDGRLSPKEHARWFAALFDEYGPALARLARTVAGRRGEHEDLFQEMMMALWKALPSYRGDCSERTYVFRIANNRAITYVSRLRPAAAELLETEVAAAPTPEEVVVESEASARLADAVAKLPPGHREVVALTLEGLTYREISDVMGISESNVGARLTRARALLRRLLQDQA